MLFSSLLRYSKCSLSLVLRRTPLLRANSQTHDRAPVLAAPARSDQCGWGRVLGGVHFRAATVAADALCAPIGKAAYIRAANLRDGTSADRVDITTVL